MDGKVMKYSQRGRVEPNAMNKSMKSGEKRQAGTQESKQASRQAYIRVQLDARAKARPSV